MSDINDLLKDLRKQRRMTLRDAAIKSGLSHSYISSLETGMHPKTKAPINPSPESLKRLAEAYSYSYEKLMEMADYLEESKKETAENAPPKSMLDQAVERIEEDLNVSIKDDPLIIEALENYLYRLGNEKKKNQAD